jgi:hypothetical protein
MTLVSLQLRSTIQSGLNTDNINGDFTHFSAHISNWLHIGRNGNISNKISP